MFSSIVNVTIIPYSHSTLTVHSVRFWTTVLAITYKVTVLEHFLNITHINIIYLTENSTLFWHRKHLFPRTCSISVGRHSVVCIFCIRNEHDDHHSGILLLLSVRVTLAGPYISICNAAVSTVLKACHHWD